MFCFLNTKKITVIIILAVGLISMAFGIIAYQSAPEDAHDYARLCGMFTGFGTGLCAVALFFGVRARLISPEKLAQEEIEKKDERNIAITRAAFTVSAVAATLLFAALAFAFVWLKYSLPAYLCIGAMYLQLIVYLIAIRVYRKRM